MLEENQPTDTFPVRFTLNLLGDITLLLQLSGFLTVSFIAPILTVRITVANPPAGKITAIVKHVFHLPWLYALSSVFASKFGSQTNQIYWRENFIFSKNKQKSVAGSYVPYFKWDTKIKGSLRFCEVSDRRPLYYITDMNVETSRPCQFI